MTFSFVISKNKRNTTKQRSTKTTTFIKTQTKNTNKPNQNHDKKKSQTPLLSNLLRKFEINQLLAKKQKTKTKTKTKHCKIRLL